MTTSNDWGEISERDFREFKRNISKAIAEFAIAFVVTFAISRSLSPYAGFVVLTVFYLNTVRRLWAKNPEATAFVYLPLVVAPSQWTVCRSLVEQMDDWPLRRLALALVYPALMLAPTWLFWVFYYYADVELSFLMSLSRASFMALTLVALVSYVVVLKLLYFPPGWFDRSRDSN